MWAKLYFLTQIPLELLHELSEIPARFMPFHPQVVQNITIFLFVSLTVSNINIIPHLPSDCTKVTEMEGTDMVWN